MIIKCDNCETNATYTCADPGVNPVNYCTECLPTWLRDRASQGDFPLVEAIEEKSSKKAKAAEPVVEEPVAEEPAADESN